MILTHVRYEVVLQSICDLRAVCTCDLMKFGMQKLIREITKMICRLCKFDGSNNDDYKLYNNNNNDLRKAQQ